MSDRAVAAIAVGVAVGVAIAVAVRRRSASDYNALAQAACAAEGKLARLAASAIRLTACVPGINKTTHADYGPWGGAGLVDAVGELECQGGCPR